MKFRFPLNYLLQSENEPKKKEVVFFKLTHINPLTNWEQNTNQFCTLSQNLLCRLFEILITILTVLLTDYWKIS